MKLSKGFTLLELLIVIGIIGILAGVIVVLINPANQLARARDAGRKSDLAGLQKALELYYNDHGSYPVGSDGSGISFSVLNEDWGACNTDSLCQLVITNLINRLPVDPSNREGGALPFLGDNAPVDQGYIYISSDGNGYILGTNLETDLTVESGNNAEYGNYQLKVNR